MPKPEIPEKNLLAKIKQAETRNFQSNAVKKAKPTSDTKTVAPGHESK